MAHYSVIILYERGPNRQGDLEYDPEIVYFGEDETMMYVKFYEAARSAQSIPNALWVKVWCDLEELVRVKIEHRAPG